MRKNPNKSFYHYKIDILDNNGVVVQTTYYMTLYEIMETFSCCKKTILDKIKTPEFNSRKLKNTRIHRVKEPVFLMVVNPECELMA